MKIILTTLLLITLLSCGQSQNKIVSKSIDTLTNRQTKTSMFDPTKLTESDKKILADFYSKRKFFDAYIQDKGLKIFTCPGCGYPTLSKRGGYEICDVCNWEDDNQDDKEADEIWGGPNSNLSLTENRINIGTVLIKNADSLKSKVNLNASYVLKTIEYFNKKKEGIGNKMTGDETLEHPIWAEWRQVEKDLQVALCCDTN
jgi:Cysteine-rich CPCC